MQLTCINMQAMYVYILYYYRPISQLRQGHKMFLIAVCSLLAMAFQHISKKVSYNFKKSHSIKLLAMSYKRKSCIQTWSRDRSRTKLSSTWWISLVTSLETGVQITRRKKSLQNAIMATQIRKRFFDILKISTKLRVGYKTAESKFPLKTSYAISIFDCINFYVLLLVLSAYCKVSDCIYRSEQAYWHRQIAIICLLDR